VYLLFTAVPILAGIFYALAYSLGLTGVLAEGFTLANWEKVLSNTAFWQTIGFSIYVAFTSIVLSLFIALGLIVRWPEAFSRGYLSFIIYLPLGIPAIVMAFYVFQLLGKGGWLSRLFYQLGLISGLQDFPDWVNDNYGLGIIFAHVCMASPFFTIFFANLYKNERAGLLREQAITLGATERQAISRVVLPVLLRRGIAAVFLYFMFVMGSYEIPLLLGSQSMQMISIRTIQKLQRYNLADIPEAYAISVVYSVLVLCMLFLLLLYNRKQLTSR
jgi:putative spermidine/putrescine transport system permease protein